MEAPTEECPSFVAFAGTFGVEVTIRSVHTRRCEGAPRPGFAARAADQEKFRRHGSLVDPFAVESCGQLGANALDLMEHWSGKSQSLRVQGSVLGTRSVRAGIEATVHRAFCRRSALVYGRAGSEHPALFVMGQPPRRIGDQGVEQATQQVPASTGVPRAAAQVELGPRWLRRSPRRARRLATPRWATKRMKHEKHLRAREAL